MTNTDVLVVGAGISGIACARRVADAGLSVRVLDRGHRIGGRMATRTLRQGTEHAADVGAPYCTASDDRFRAVVDRWVELGLAREWTDTFVTAGPLGVGETSSGPMRYASVCGMRALVEQLAEGLDVTGESTVERVEPGRRVGDWTAGVVVLAMPGPQAARILQPNHANIAAIADQPYDPTIAVVARYPKRTWAAFDGAFVAHVDELRWIADDGTARGDDEPVLVAHSTPDFARRYLDDPQAAAAPMLKALRGTIGASGDPDQVVVQRWTFAQPTGPREATFSLSGDGIALCGDGWSPKSKVEAAYLSGLELGDAIAARLA